MMNSKQRLITIGGSGKGRGEKLYCICRTPYDQTKSVTCSFLYMYIYANALSYPCIHACVCSHALTYAHSYARARMHRPVYFTKTTKKTTNFGTNYANTKMEPKYETRRLKTMEIKTPVSSKELSVFDRS